MPTKLYKFIIKNKLRYYTIINNHKKKNNIKKKKNIF